MPEIFLEKGNPLLSVREAAAFANVHPETVKKWIYRGKLRSCKAGSRLRIPKKELERFLGGGA